jgi:hypothetical protein
MSDSSDSSEKLSRIIFLVSLGLVLFFAVFFAGALAFRYNLPPIAQIRTAYQTLTEPEESDVLTHPRRHHLQPARGQGEGVTANAYAGDADDGALVMMAGFFDEENQVRLIRRDGTVVHRWPLDYLEHFPDPETRVCDLPTPLSVDTHGAHVTPEGETVVNYEYCGTVKLDRCGEVLWTLPTLTHHSLVPAEGGGYWILGRFEWIASEEPERFPPFSSINRAEVIKEDTLMLVSEDGEILSEVSIPEIMMENGLEALLTATGRNFRSWQLKRPELIHANQATELPAALAQAFPMFEAGDLAVSMRQLNLVMVLDPDTREVKWHQVGPWLRQHDAEFRPDGRLSIFNNNVYRTAYSDEQTILETPFRTNIILVDPATGETEVAFGERPGQEMLSVIRGQHALLPGDGILITEFDAGRVIEVDAAREIVWEYVNAYDETRVGEIRNAEIYPPGYFAGDWDGDWGSCPR